MPIYLIVRHPAELENHWQEVSRTGWPHGTMTSPLPLAQKRTDFIAEIGLDKIETPGTKIVGV